MTALVRLAAASVVALTLSVPALADTAPQAAVRAGDSSLSCEAIIAEINSLSAGQAKAAQGAEQRAKVGRGLASLARGALTVATPMLTQGAMSGYRADAMGSAFATQAVQQAQMQAMAAAMNAGGAKQAAAGYGAPAPVATPVAAGPSPRQAHLSGLFMQRGC